MDDIKLDLNLNLNELEKIASDACKRFVTEIVTKFIGGYNPELQTMIRDEIKKYILSDDFRLLIREISIQVAPQTLNQTIAEYLQLEGRKQMKIIVQEAINNNIFVKKGE